jgi:hypothetical protein
MLAIILLVAGVMLLSFVMVALLPLGLFLFVCSLGLLLTAFWIWMLVDCIKNERLGDNERIVWVLVVVFTHWLGALIYFFAGRKPARAGQLGG